MLFDIQDGTLVGKRQGETLRIEAWGSDALRVRATRYPQFTGNDWALTVPPASCMAPIEQVQSACVGEDHDEFMCELRYLVAPVLELGMREREVYLPAGTWRDTRDGATYEGPVTLVAEAPLESIPVYERMI